MTRTNTVSSELCLRQVTAALQATCSSDPDVLYARKEELLADTRRMARAATLQIVAGAAISMTIVGAIFGVPAIRRGLERKRCVADRVEAVESGYREYLTSLAEKQRITKDLR